MPNGVGEKVNRICIKRYYSSDGSGYDESFQESVSLQHSKALERLGIKAEGSIGDTGSECKEIIESTRSAHTSGRLSLPRMTGRIVFRFW